MHELLTDGMSRRSFLNAGGMALLGGLGPVMPAGAEVSRRRTVRAEIQVDVSGSLNGLDVAWTRLRAELPQIVELFAVEMLAVSVFDVDGYVPRLLTQPVLTFPVAAATPVSVVDKEREQLVQKCQQYPMDNLRRICIDNGQKDHATRIQAQQARDETARGDHRRALADALATLDSLRLPERESPSSDVVGALVRWSHVVDPGVTLAMLITDLADTAHRELPLIPPPEADVRLLVLLVPAKPRDAARAWGRPMSAGEQFPWQASMLQRAVPWCRAVPALVTRGFAAQFPEAPARVSKTSPRL